MLFIEGDEVKGKDVPSVTGYSLKLIKHAKIIGFKKWKENNRIVTLEISYSNFDNRSWFSKYGIVERVGVPESELELITPKYNDPDLFI